MTHSSADGRHVKRDVDGGGRLLTLACMAAVLMLALAIRLHRLDATDLWLDEALTVVLSNWSFSNLLLYPVDPTPGLYYMLHKGLIPVGASVWTVRLLPVAAGLLAIPLMFLLGRTLFGARAGWIAAILLAVWPAHVEHSQDARAYALLFATTLCASLGAALFAKAWLSGVDAPQRQRIGALAVHATGAVLALHTHVTAVFWVAGATLLLVVTAGLARRRTAWVEVGLYVLVLFLLSGAGLYRLVLEVSTGDSFHWLPQASPRTFVITTLQVMFPPGPYGADLPLSRPIWYASGVVLALLGAFALRRRQLAATPFNVVAWMLVLGYLALPLAVWLVGFVTTPIFMPRTILYAAPGAILSIAVVLANVGPRAGVAATAVLTLLWAGAAAFTLQSGREHWSEAGRQLAARVKAGDTIVVCPAWKYAPLRHALLEAVDAPALAPDPNGRILVLEAALGSDPNWARSYHRRYEVPQAERRLGRELEDPDGPPSMPAVPMKSGSTLWLVSGNCSPAHLASIEKTIPAKLGPLTPVWTDTYAYDPLSLSRRSVLTDAVFSELDQ